ncbi:MAG: NAD(P)-dependent oxidoreductase [Rhizobiaceae bacterium]
MRTIDNTSVGFVGIGNMGRPMAANLVKAGWRVIVHDADGARAAAVASEIGCGTSDSLAGLAASCDVVILMLPDGRIVRRVAAGDGDSLMAGLGAGKTIIDMSSSAPVGTRELGAELARSGVAMLDAPVSGGVKGAVAGSLSIMVGGPEALAAEMDPILSAMGRRFYVGPLGAGHAVKVLNNYVSAAGLAAAAEALLVAERFGVEGAVLIDVLNASTGRNNSTENKFKQYVLNGAYNSGFALDLMVKDLGLAMEVAQACGVDATLGRSCLGIWQDARSWIGADADHTEFARFVLERDANGRPE